MATFGILIVRPPLDEIWGVRFYFDSAPVHAVKGLRSRVTCCGQHFSGGAGQEELPVTCEQCLVQIGCLAVEV